MRGVTDGKVARRCGEGGFKSEEERRMREKEDRRAKIVEWWMKAIRRRRMGKALETEMRFGEGNQVVFDPP